MAIIDVENLSFCYPNKRENAISNISFSVEKGEFITVCGETASGKSTLLKMLKKELAPVGSISGKVLFCGKDLSLADPSKIGFVMQQPEQQIVTDTVWHELAFGLENIGTKPNIIRSRVAETAAYFGIEDLFNKKTAELSGGQKQLLNLAAIMAMQPEVLILDEPTSQLDPIAANEFISAIFRLNRELSITIIIAEHRLEQIVPLSNKLMAIENGKITVFDTPEKAVKLLKNSTLFSAMPTAAQVFCNLDENGDLPLNVPHAKQLIENNFCNDIRLVEVAENISKSSAALEFSGVYFRYNRNDNDVLKNLNFTVFENEVFCILGGNGSGKSTTLFSAAGVLKPYSGCIKVFNKKISQYKNQSLHNGCVALLPQDVQTMFLKNTVAEELCKLADENNDLPFDLNELKTMHPYDLSGGQQQLVALAKVLATKPKLLLLDEPTKGIDSCSKRRLCGVLQKLKSDGLTVVIVTHDIEFAAGIADRCAMFFNGEIVSTDEPHSFFSQNAYYTTFASRISKGFFDNAITADEIVYLCRKNGKKGGAK